MKLSLLLLWLLSCWKETLELTLDKEVEHFQKDALNTLEEVVINGVEEWLNEYEDPINPSDQIFNNEVEQLDKGLEDTLVQILDDVVEQFDEASAQWYCAVKLNGGVQIKSADLSAAQKALGAGDQQSIQSIIPMTGSEAGHPQIIGGSRRTSLGDINDMQKQCSNVGPLLTASVKWYCAVSLNRGGVQTKSSDLTAAQKTLGVGNDRNRQAIIPMTGSNAGDPHILPKTWNKGSMWWHNWNDINAMRDLCSNEGPLIPASTEWYCAVKLIEGVQLKAGELKKAQDALGVGSDQNRQAIIPMMGSEAGDPHTLPKTWRGGSMWWHNWDDINAMRKQCSIAGALLTDPCPVYDITYDDSAVNITSSIDTWQECGTLCERSEVCKYWSWISNRFESSSQWKECRMMTSNGGRKEAVGVISGSTRCGDPAISECARKAQSLVNQAIARTQYTLRNTSPRSAGELVKRSRHPTYAAIQIGRDAEIFEIAIALAEQSECEVLKKHINHTYHFHLSPEHVQLLGTLSGCSSHERVVNCDLDLLGDKYRTIDGTCNNKNKPLQGASLTPYSRMLRENYENGFNAPRGWQKTVLPSAREISLKVLSIPERRSVLSETLTHMVMQWGQFLDHDLGFTAGGPSNRRFIDGEPCSSSCENEEPCFPIKIASDDPRIKSIKCMEFVRSAAACGSGATSVFFGSLAPRQQINQLTSYIDASNVYGSDAEEEHELRKLDDDQGLLRYGLPTKSGKYLLPFDQNNITECLFTQGSDKRPSCFLAGDHRVNEQLALISMHTIWMRQHNRLAKELRQINPYTDGETVYQETRKIVGAQMQHITYTEWLPKILGPEGMEQLGKYQGYKSDVDASVSNTFTTAAFRFGHTLIQPIMSRLDASMNPIPEGNLALHEAFFSPHRVIDEGGIDPLLRGLFGTPAQHNEGLNNELTEHLFAISTAVALDLASLNIQRGRDHGIPTYNQARRFCNLPVAVNFDNFREQIQNSTILQKLDQLYGNVDDVDLFVGGVLEDIPADSRVGPTFRCLIGAQFQRLRDGDRFFYENPGVFSPQQLEQIKKTTLAKVICDNADDIQQLQLDAFQRGGVDLPCSQHPKVDLSLHWRDRYTGKK